MSRASEKVLGQLHNEVASTIRELMQDEDPNVRAKALQAAIKFLKDNEITTTVAASDHLAGIREHLNACLPDDSELESLAARTPDRF